MLAGLISAVQSVLNTLKTTVDTNLNDTITSRASASIWSSTIANRINATVGSRQKGPVSITPYTSGSGTYVPSVDLAWCRVTLVGGGGAGGSSSTSGAYYGLGGSGAQTVVAWIRVPIAGLPYVVGTGGVSGGANSSSSTFGGLYAACGKQGPINATSGSGVSGGGHGFSNGFAVAGGSGGGFFYKTGRPSGMSDPDADTTGVPLNGGSGGSGGGGGNSCYGIGGNAAVSAGVAGSPGAGYGAGGGGTNGNGTAVTGGSGSGGIIIIEDFGLQV